MEFLQVPHEVHTDSGVSAFSGLEYWNGVLEWSTGMEYWTGVLDWSAGDHDE
jgi:hypothetical protein